MRFGGAPFKLTPEDMGTTDFGAAFGRGLDNYVRQQRARYAQPMMEEQLKQSQITTEFMPREKEADIGYRGAATRHMGAQTDILGKDLSAYDDRLRAELDAKRAALESSQISNQMQRFLQEHQPTDWALRYNQGLSELERARIDESRARMGLPVERARTNIALQDLEENPDFFSAIPGKRAAGIYESIPQPSKPGFLKGLFSPSAKRQYEADLIKRDLAKQLSGISDVPTTPEGRRVGRDFSDVGGWDFMEISMKSGFKHSPDEIKGIVAMLMKQGMPYSVAIDKVRNKLDQQTGTFPRRNLWIW